MLRIYRLNKKSRDSLRLHKNDYKRIMPDCRGFYDNLTLIVINSHENMLIKCKMAGVKGRQIFCLPNHFGFGKWSEPNLRRANFQVSLATRSHFQFYRFQILNQLSGDFFNTRYKVKFIFIRIISV